MNKETKKAERVITMNYIQNATLLEKVRVLQSLVANIDHDTLRMYRGELDAPTKREANEAIETFGYKINWLKECGQHLKKFSTPNKWHTNLDY